MQPADDLRLNRQASGLGWSPHSTLYPAMCDTDASCDFTRPAAPIAAPTSGDLGPVYRVLHYEALGVPSRPLAAGLTWAEARELCEALNAEIRAQFPGLTMARPICTIERAMPMIHRGLPKSIGDQAILKFASEPRSLAGGALVFREWFEVGRVEALKPLRVVNVRGELMGQGGVVGYLSADEIDPGRAMELVAQRAAKAAMFGGEFSNLQAIAHAVAPALRPEARWVSVTDVQDGVRRAIAPCAGVL